MSFCLVHIDVDRVGMLYDCVFFPILIDAFISYCVNRNLYWLYLALAGNLFDILTAPFAIR